MWSLVVILMGGAQLCFGLPRQQQQGVDVLESARVNCKVSATVTYPETASEDAIPTVDCTHSCGFKTEDKDQTYFIGYVYRHFERLEQEYGLMLEIRYSRGGFRSCVLVPASTDEVVFSTHSENNSPCAPISITSTTVPTTIPPTTIPTTVPVTHDPAPTTYPTTIPTTTILTTVPITHDPIPTTVPTTIPPTTIPTTVPITHDPVPTKVPTTKPPTTILTTVLITHDPVPTTVPTTTPPTTIPTTVPITHDPRPTTVPTTIRPTTILTTIPITHDSVPTTVPTTIPPTTIPTTVPITHDPLPTTVPTTISPTTITTTVPITHDPIPTTVPTTIQHHTTTTTTTTTTTEQTTTTPPTTTTTTPPTTTSWVCGGNDWVLIGTACFHVSSAAGGWHQGQDYCTGLGAQLASVNSQEEQDGLAGLAGNNAWIGLHDMQSEGDHLWEDQSTLAYSNWEPGQPDDSGSWLWWGGEDCVEMSISNSFRWNDQDCSNENIYICRKDAALQG